MIYLISVAAKYIFSISQCMHRLTCCMAARHSRCAYPYKTYCDTVVFSQLAALSWGGLAGVQSRSVGYPRSVTMCVTIDHAGPARIVFIDHSLKSMHVS